MTSPHKNYNAVIGLEIHVQLNTERKLFAPEGARFGEPPNTQVSEVTLAHPGTLPVVNRKAVSHALKMALACKATITREIWFDRKNYYYPDLPKGFQITQDRTPICRDGVLVLRTLADGSRPIHITKIQLEEDTGKSIHTATGNRTLVNFNRAGLPLIEVVTAPDFRNGEEASSFLAELRRLVRYLEISDGDMEKASLRCDANVSIHEKGSKKLGVKVEVKNMNSMRHVRMAIAHEISRQIAIKKAGEEVAQETRTYDALRDMTLFMRSKETLADYGFMTEPDISPIVISDAWQEKVKQAMPTLPWVFAQELAEVYQLTPEHIAVLTEEKEMALFFQAACVHTTHYQTLANWMKGPVRSYLNSEKVAWSAFPINPIQLAAFINAIQKHRLSFSIAAQKVFPYLLAHPETNITAWIADQELQIDDKAQLAHWIQEVLDTYPEKVHAYRQGKTGLLAFFMGQVMRLSKGKANPTHTMAELKVLLTTMKSMAGGKNNTQ